LFFYALIFMPIPDQHAQHSGTGKPTGFPMANITSQQILGVHHWNDTLFSFSTTRDPALRFRNGEFLMIGLTVDGKPLLRAYSIASANYEEHLEFFSIKVPDGPLTSRLQHIQPGDEVLVSRKPTGTLVVDDLKPGKRLYLFGTGTGLAPFLAVIKDPETYERFEQVILFQGARRESDLAYQKLIREELPGHEFLGEMVREQLLYYPALTRQAYRHTGRLTDLIQSDQLTDDLELPALDPAEDRVMLCGGPAMLQDVSALLNDRGFAISPRTGEPGDYVIERAFVER